ncbi:MAG: ribbon-helix-helix protein, CopG family [Deltaproteobacteria bacterium]|nr:ribbon-helix-helix protein, CopG family [Deltaproteobacteria bacterium]
MSKIVSIRIPDSLASSIALIARKTEMPKSFHIKKALEIYLEEMADMQIAANRLNDSNDPIISLSDMRTELEL